MQNHGLPSPICPAIAEKVSYHLVNGETTDWDDFKVWEIFFSGDQLTAARIRSALSNRADHPNAIDRLEGLIPTYSGRLAC